MNKRFSILGLSLGLMASTHAIAQTGSPSCATATAITGPGSGQPDIVNGVTPLDTGTLPSCSALDQFGLPLAQGAVWYDYTATTTGAVQIAINSMPPAGGSGVNGGVIATAYSACGGAEIACADDIRRSGHGPLIFPIVAGQHYRIRVATYASTSFTDDFPSTIGSFNAVPNTHANLVFAELPSIPGNPGESCTNPRVITTAGSPYLFDNATAALNDGTAAPACVSSPGISPVWFSYTPQFAGQTQVTIGDPSVGNATSLIYTNNQVIVSVYTACGGASIACTPANTNPMTVTFASNPSQTYRIRVAINTSSTFNGQRNIAVSQVSIPVNDTCAGAIDVGPGQVNGVPANPTPIYWYDEGASSGAPFSTCGFTTNLSNQRDVWFRYTASITGTAAIHVGENNTLSNNNTDIAVFDGTCGSTTQIACASRSNANNWWAGIRTVAGHQYLIRLSRLNSVQVIHAPIAPATTTTARLFIREFSPPTNETCSPANATLLTPGVVTAWTNVGAVDDDAFDLAPTICGDNGYNNPSAAIWFRVPINHTGIATFHTTVTPASETNAGVYMDAYLGGCGGTPIACYRSDLTIPVTNGTDVYIRLWREITDGNSDYYTSGTISVQLTDQIPGDECSTAIPISTGSTAFDSARGTDNPADPGWPCLNGFDYGLRHDLWYTYTAPADGTLQVDTCSVVIGDWVYDTHMEIFDAPNNSCGGTMLACDFNDGNTVRTFSRCTNAQSACRLVVDAGHTYHIRIASAPFLNGHINLDFFPAAVDPLASAKRVTGSGPLSVIAGSLSGTPADVVSDRANVDLYKIYICDPGNFYATTSSGDTIINTALYLFDSSGHGVAMHDDLSLDTTEPQSLLTSQFVTSPGLYYLAVTGGIAGGPEGDQDMARSAGGFASGRLPISSVGGATSNRGIWNPTPATIERAPDGPGAAGVLTGWTGMSGIPVYVNAPWSYRVLINGACYLCPADLDNGSATGTPDGGVDINDLLYFLVQFENGSVAADLDNGSGDGVPDEGVDINDLLYFLIHFESGC